MEELVKAEKLKKCAIDEASFKDDDNKVRFYTGLPCWSILHTLFTFVELCLSTHTSLSSFKQLLLTLMRLRLSLSGEDLGYRFGIHQSTVSRVFANTFDVLYAKLKCLIIWSDREVLRKTLPMDFCKYSPNCAVIIDCFEIFIERPSDLKARAQTYSIYKHHNTVKYPVLKEASVLYRKAGVVGLVINI